jgi:hypothetical protein
MGPPNVYRRPGKEFASHQAVDHSRDEYAYRDEFSGRIVSINVSGNFYNIFKRGMGFITRLVRAHLHRYLADFDFRCNSRSAARSDEPQTTEPPAFRP